MKYNLELLRADVHDELVSIRKVAVEIRSRADLLDRPASEVPGYDRGAFGYLLHNLYNGMENIFLSIARFFENDISAESWHSDLLKRMKLEVTGYRPAVIDQELYALLNDLRGFRHVFRHSYAFELDWEKEALVGRRAERAVRLFEERILRFLEAIGAVDKDTTP